jgi:hypothetical protein
MGSDSSSSERIARKGDISVNLTPYQACNIQPARRPATIWAKFRLPDSRCPRMREPITKSYSFRRIGVTNASRNSGQSLPSPSMNTITSAPAFHTCSTGSAVATDRLGHNQRSRFLGSLCSMVGAAVDHHDDLLHESRNGTHHLPDDFTFIQRGNDQRDHQFVCTRCKIPFCRKIGSAAAK